MRHRPERHGAQRQADLFEPPPPRPRWPDLPHDTRMTVTALLAQLSAASDGTRFRHPLRRWSMSEKLTAHHLARRAIVYVRQSSHQQVVHNRESQRRQYAMEQRVRDLGWHETEVIDEDQGRSATSTHGRTGFQRMVAEVCLGRVGAVAAIEVSRFARDNRDWHQLIEMCGMVETLLIDNDTIYDPRRANDRLLLGLKGSMS